MTSRRFADPQRLGLHVEFGDCRDSRFSKGHHVYLRHAVSNESLGVIVFDGDTYQCFHRDYLLSDIDSLAETLRRLKDAEIERREALRDNSKPIRFIDVIAGMAHISDTDRHIASIKLDRAGIEMLECMIAEVIRTDDTRVVLPMGGVLTRENYDYIFDGSFEGGINWTREF